MKIKQILVAFLFATLVISCGNKAKDIDISEKAKDIDVSELKTECEVIDAMKIVMDEVVALALAVDSEVGASEEQKKEYESLDEKMTEINQKVKELDLDEDKAEDCPNYETGKKNQKRMKKAIKKLEKAISPDPKEAGEKAGKEVCEKIKSGDFSPADSQKLIKEAQESIDDEADAQIWLEAYMAAVTPCLD